MRLPTAILTLALLPLLAHGEPAPTPAATDEIGTLIRDLSSDTYQTREAATEKLVNLGESALPRLQQLLPLTVDGETRNRIQSAIDQIAEGAAAGQSLITLDVTDADPKSVFADLSRQAHAEIRVAPELLQGLPKVTLRADHEPFWPVLRRLCSPLGLAPDSISNIGIGGFGRRMQPATAPNDHSLTLVKAGEAWDRTPTTFSGPFMICVQRITQTGVVLPATDQRVHNLVVECVVQAEPKLTVVGRNATARVTIPDPANVVPGGPMIGGMANLRPPFSSRAYYNPTAASVWPLVVPLAVPKEATEKLPQLKATSSAKVLVRSETWELPDIARAAPRSWNVAGRTFSVTAVNRQGDAVEVIATATRRVDRGAMDPEDMAIFNSLELLDPQSRPLTARARSPRPSENPSKLAYTLLFEATAEGAPILPASTPLRLRWRLPLETKDIDIPFDFSDLPLP